MDNYKSLLIETLAEGDLVPKVKKAVPSDKRERQVPLRDICRKFYREVKWDLHEGSNADIPDNIVKAFEKAGGKGWINRKTPKYIEYKGEVHGYTISGTISLSSLDSDLERFAEDLTMAYNVSLGGKRQRIPDFIKSLKEDLLPDEVYDTLVRKSKKTYVVGVYSTLPGPGWHYEINTEYGVYAKVPDDEGFIAHWFIQGKPQPSVEEMEDMAHYLIDEYDCREVSLDEYKRIVNGKLTEDTVKTSDGKWTNKGKEGTHGKFRTKKAADAQRRAIWVNWNK